MEETEMHIAKWENKKLVWKGCMLYDSNCATFCKRKNHRDVKNTIDRQGFGASGQE